MGKWRKKNICEKKYLNNYIQVRMEVMKKLFKIKLVCC